MHKLILLLSVLSLFISCGRKEEEPEEKVTGFETLNPGDSKELSEDELSRAKRICAALTIKRRNIINDLVGKEKYFNFRRVSVDCRSVITEYEDVKAFVRAPLNPKDDLNFIVMEGADSSALFLSDIITDKSDFMVDFCESIVNQKKPLNVIDYREFSYRYIFPEKELETIEVITYLKRADSESLFASRAERLVINLASGEDKGYLKERVSGAFCSEDRKKLAETRQATDFL